MDNVGLVDTMPPSYQSGGVRRLPGPAQCQPSPEVDAAAYSGDAWLGIDAGSTTTKMALISPDGGLLYTYYHSNQGNPVAIVLEQLRAIYRLCETRIRIKGAAVTGYGEDLIKTPSAVT